jgi:uncharacterized protein YdeI (YjbR/CyaY-like superfamily)
MTEARPYPVLAFGTIEAWSEWLQRHHASHGGIAMKIAKKDGGGASISYAEALDIAIAYGWIDGRTGAVDDSWYTRRFGPRAPRSSWSKINRAKAEALIAAGAMKPAGLAEVERARADGRWAAAYDGARTAQVPDDLQAALNASPEAKAFFATLSSQNRYAVLHHPGRQEAADPRRPHRPLRRHARTGRDDPLNGGLFGQGPGDRRRPLVGRPSLQTGVVGAQGGRDSGDAVVEQGDGDERAQHHIGGGEGVAH